MLFGSICMSNSEHGVKGNGLLCENGPPCF